MTRNLDPSYAGKMYTLIFTVAVLATGQIVEIEDEDKKFMGKPALSTGSPRTRSEGGRTSPGYNEDRRY